MTVLLSACFAAYGSSLLPLSLRSRRRIPLDVHDFGVCAVFCCKHCTNSAFIAMISMFLRVTVCADSSICTRELETVDQLLPELLLGSSCDWRVYCRNSLTLFLILTRLPLPGGLGALEASQVFALGAFGISAASAISVTFLIRGRDLLIGGLGLLFAGNSVRK